MWQDWSTGVVPILRWIKGPREHILGLIIVAFWGQSVSSLRRALHKQMLLCSQLRMQRKRRLLECGTLLPGVVVAYHSFSKENLLLVYCIYVLHYEWSRDVLGRSCMNVR